MAPWVASGANNLAALNTATQKGGSLDPNARYQSFDFNALTDPGAAYRTQGGVNAITAAGAAAGNLGSGKLGTALTQFGEDAASQEYQNAFSRYQTGLNDWNAQRSTQYNQMAGMANPQAVEQMGNFAMQSGVNAGDTMQTGAAQQNAGSQQSFNNTGSLLTGATNIGKSLYDWYTNSNPPQAPAAANNMTYTPGSGYTYTSPQAVGPPASAASDYVG
jgi:hypothetical protein